MAQLIVVTFRGDIFRAGRVLYRLSEMNADWVVDLEDAVAIYRDHTGELRLDESYQMTTGREAGLGAFWGALVGALIAIPLTAGASGAALAGTLAASTLGASALGAAGCALDAKLWKEAFGVPEEFVKAAAATIQPRDSAILALLHVVDPEKLANEFRGYGGTMVQTTLTTEQAARVQAILDGAPWPGSSENQHNV